MKPRLGYVVAFILLGMMLWGTVCRAADGKSVRRTPVVIAVEKVEHSVANISTEHIRVITYYDSPFRFRDMFLDRFFNEYFRRYEAPIKVETPIGSGVVIDEDGYVLTNDHVASKASNLKVRLFDKSCYEGRLVSTDPANDLAVIKIEPKKPLKAIALGRAGDIMLGETVIALGNPLGLENTVTTGVVSAKDREITIGEGGERIKYQNLIQTDAAINPGNSGGPLVNLDGELIGINTCIVDSAEGIGFAISVGKVRAILTKLFNFRELSRLWFGVELSEDAAGRVRVEEVEKGSPAERAGILAGDVILRADDEPAVGVLGFRKHIFKRKAGDIVRITLRRNGRELVTNVKLAQAPSPPVQELASRRLGIGVENVTRQLAREMGLYARWGVLVQRVERDSPADRQGLEPGDVLVQIEGQNIHDVNDLGIILDRLKPGDAISFAVVRGRFILTGEMRCR